MRWWGKGGGEVGRLGENWYEFMDEFDPNTEAQQAPQVFAAQAGFACAAPGLAVHDERQGQKYNEHSCCFECLLV